MIGAPILISLADPDPLDQPHAYKGVRWAAMEFSSSRKAQPPPLIIEPTAPVGPTLSAVALTGFTRRPYVAHHRRQHRGSEHHACVL